jgi:hypothetical protein
MFVPFAQTAISKAEHSSHLVTVTSVGEGDSDFIVNDQILLGGCGMSLNVVLLRFQGL